MVAVYDNSTTTDEIGYRQEGNSPWTLDIEQDMDCLRGFNVNMDTSNIHVILPSLRFTPAVLVL